MTEKPRSVEGKRAEGTSQHLSSAIRRTRTHWGGIMSETVGQYPEPLPPPGLFSAEIPNRGPIIDPPFVDVPDYSQYLPRAETRPVDFDVIEPRISDDTLNRAVDVALASDRATRKLQEKRYEVLQVGTRSLDRQTDHPLVVIYNYTDDVVLEVTVDAVRRSVHEVTVEHYQPALTDSEESRALEMVRDDGRLAEAGIDVGTGVGLIVEDVDLRSPRCGHRLVDLRFGPEDHYLPRAFAIVDLSEGDVVRTGLLPREEGSS